jgi:hypothetical protein
MFLSNNFGCPGCLCRLAKEIFCDELFMRFLLLPLQDWQVCLK